MKRNTKNFREKETITSLHHYIANKKQNKKAVTLDHLNDLITRCMCRGCDIDPV